MTDEELVRFRSAEFEQNQFKSRNEDGVKRAGNNQTKEKSLKITVKAKSKI